MGSVYVSVTMAPPPALSLHSWVSILSLVCLLPSTQASCFGRDAHFKAVAPAVIQPDRNDPTKVLVSWDQAVERPQCVDRYYVRVWAEGLNMTQGSRIMVSEKDRAKNQVVLTKTVIIEPCLTYKFLVELEELDSVTGRDLEKTREATFKTTAVASLPRTLQLSDVTATYLWDTTKNTLDLSKAVVSLSATAIKYPNCLDYIQLTGAEVLPSPPLSRGGTSRGEVLQHITQGCQQESTNYQNRVRSEVIPQVLSWADCSQRCTRKPTCTAWSWNRASAHPQYALKCALMEGYSNTAPDSNTVSGPRGCMPAPEVRQPSSPTTTTRNTGSSYASIAGGSSRAISTPQLNTLPKPRFAFQLPRDRRSNQAARMIGPLKLNPPYLKRTIDIVVPVEDCAGYMFHLQIHGARTKLGEVGSIPLPALADMPEYVPPPVTSTVSVAFDNSGSPVYRMNPNTGIPASCLSAYFEAYDSYAQRMENEITWLPTEGERVLGLAGASTAQLEASQAELLQVSQCVCTSPHIELATTDPEILRKSEASQLGDYHFAGVFADHPYYKKTVEPHTVSPPSSPSATTARPRSSPPPAEPIYLYFEPGKKQWVFGKTLGATSGRFFGTTEQSTAKCPADTTTQGTWQTATGTFGRWKPNNKVTVTCKTNLVG